MFSSSCAPLSDAAVQESKTHSRFFFGHILDLFAGSGEDSEEGAVILIRFDIYFDSSGSGSDSDVSDSTKYWTVPEGSGWFNIFDLEDDNNEMGSAFDGRISQCINLTIRNVILRI